MSKLKPLSVGLCLEGKTLWAACAEVPLFGGSARFCGSTKFDLLNVPDETRARAHYYSEALKLVLQKLSYPAGALALALPEEDTFLRHFDIPQVAAEDLRAAASFEAQKYLPFAMKDLYTDFSVFPIPQTKKQGVVFSAARRDTVDDWKKAVMLAGYSLDFVLPQNLTVFNLMNHKPARSATGQAVAFASLRQSGTLLFTVGRGSEVLMSHSAKVQPNAAIGEEPKKIESNAVVKQISFFLNFFEKNFRGLKITELQMTMDPGCAETNLESILKTELGFPVSMIAGAQLFNGSAASITGSELIALEVARARVKSPLGLGAKKRANLLGSEKAVGSATASSSYDEGDAETLKRLVITEAIVIAGIFLCLHFYFLGKLNDTKKALTQIKTQTESSVVPEEILKAEDLTIASANLSKKAAFAAKTYGQRSYWTGRLSQIAKLIPEDIALDVLEITDLHTTSAGSFKSLRLEGHFGSSGEDTTSLNQFFAALKSSPVMAEGLGALKISKLRKVVDPNGNYISSIFFIDTESPEKSS